MKVWVIDEAQLIGGTSQSVVKIIPRDATVFYLGTRYHSIMEVKDRLQGHAQVIIPEQEFHTLSDQLQPDIVDFWARLTAKNLNSSEAWWCTHFASRSATATGLMRTLVYFFCAIERLKKRQDSEIIFALGSHALGQAILRAARSQGAQVLGWRARPIRLWIETQVYQRLRWPGKLLRFFVESLARRFYARRYLKKPTPRAEKKIFIRSWITDGGLGVDSTFTDRNFGPLPSWLKSQGWEIWNSPMFFNLKGGALAEIKKLGRSKENFVMPEQVFGFWDYVWIFKIALQQLRLRNWRDTPLLGHEVWDILEEDFNHYALNIDLLHLATIYRLFYRFHEKGIQFDSILYPFENNAPEKIFVLGVRKFFPKTELIGFQHTVWLHDQPSYRISKTEVNTYPLPDKIICSGKIYLDVIKNAGFPASLLTLGANLRFHSVHNPVKTKVSHTGKNILCVLNYNTDLSLEMIEKLDRALSALATYYPDNSVWIKHHPLNHFQRLETFIRQKSQYKMVEGALSEWIPQADAVLVSGASVTLLETAIQGVPVIRFVPANQFYFDPLWSDYPIPRVTTTQELEAALRRIFDLTPSQKQDLAALGQTFLRDYFEPVTPEKMKAFLPSEHFTGRPNGPVISEKNGTSGS